MNNLGCCLFYESIFYRLRLSKDTFPEVYITVKKHTVPWPFLLCVVARTQFTYNIIDISFR